MERSWSRQQWEAAGGKVRRGPLAQPEHDEQVLFFRMLEWNLARYPALKWVHAIPNGGFRNKATAGKMKAEGVKSGVSDIFVPIPANGYHGLYIEMKYGKNTLSPVQKEFRDFVIARGYSFYLAYSAAEAMAALSIYLGIVLRMEKTL
jgi:hypothetical protein